MEKFESNVALCVSCFVMFERHVPYR